jgi:hexokinase
MFGVTPNRKELELMRRLAELIGTRSARLFACGIAAIAKNKCYKTCHVGVDGSVFKNYPACKARTAQALRDILDWPAKIKLGDSDPIKLLPAEDGSSVGAALIVALTLKRVKEGNMVGILSPENFN